MEESDGWTTYIPKFEYTTDNAAMIGIVGYLKYLNKDFDREDSVASSRLDMEK
jgi:N6-L-threonylcarbamoyladenine synthase